MKAQIYIHTSHCLKLREGFLLALLGLGLFFFEASRFRKIIETWFFFSALMIPFSPVLIAGYFRGISLQSQKDFLSERLFLCIFLFQSRQCEDKVVECYLDVNIPESHIHPCPNRDNVLVSAAKHLIFFLAASIVLCFGFRMEIMLVTQGCLLSSAYTECRTRQFPTSSGSRLRVHRELGGATARTADQNWPKGFPISYGIIVST